MANNRKWNLDTTTKFIQCYKQNECLWNFSSPDYKDKGKREAAYIAIVTEMNIDDFGVQEVKNKIKNLRSTYNQEIKKVEKSKKSGRVNVYISNIKWLKDMGEVFMNESRRKSYDSIKSEYHVPDEQAEQDVDSQYLIPMAQENSSQSSSDSTDTPENIATRSRPKKRSREIVEAINNLKTLHDKLNVEEETPFDIFGKSVAMQLKVLSVENALLAQQKIQCILTEIGIADYRGKTENIAPMSKYNYRSDPLK